MFLRRKNKSKALVLYESSLSVKVKKTKDGHIVTKESFGISVVENGKPGVMSFIIPKGKKLPVSSAKFYRPVRDFQPEIKISAYKGENSLVASNEFLGSFFIAIPRKTILESKGVQVKFSIDRKGVILVDAIDLENPSNALKIKLQYKDRDGLVKAVAKGVVKEFAGILIPGKKR